MIGDTLCWLWGGPVAATLLERSQPPWIYGLVEGTPPPLPPVNPAEWVWLAEGAPLNAGTSAWPDRGGIGGLSKLSPLWSAGVNWKDWAKAGFTGWTRGDGEWARKSVAALGTGVCCEYVPVPRELSIVLSSTEWPLCICCGFGAFRDEGSLEELARCIGGDPLTRATVGGSGLAGSGWGRGERESGYENVWVCTCSVCLKREREGDWRNTVQHLILTLLSCRNWSFTFSRSAVFLSKASLLPFSLRASASTFSYLVFHSSASRANFSTCQSRACDTDSTDKSY